MDRGGPDAVAMRELREVAVDGRAVGLDRARSTARRGPAVSGDAPARSARSRGSCRDPTPRTEVVTISGPRTWSMELARRAGAARGRRRRAHVDVREHRELRRAASTRGAARPARRRAARREPRDVEDDQRRSRRRERRRRGPSRADRALDHDHRVALLRRAPAGSRRWSARCRRSWSTSRGARHQPQRRDRVVLAREKLDESRRRDVRARRGRRRLGDARASRCRRAGSAPRASARGARPSRRRARRASRRPPGSGRGARGRHRALRGAGRSRPSTEQATTHHTSSICSSRARACVRAVPSATRRLPRRRQAPPAGAPQRRSAPTCLRSRLERRSPADGSARADRRTPRANSRSVPVGPPCPAIPPGLGWLAALRRVIGTHRARLRSFWNFLVNVEN